MLTITVLGEEQFDEEHNKFLYPNSFTLELEHSLVSLSKWEQKWRIPFLSDLERHKKTTEMVLDYVRCMLLTPNPPEDWMYQLSQENVDAIQEYLGDTPTASWFSDQPEPKNDQLITNELVYYWLTTAGIPWDPAETWNLNRLFTLIKTFSVNNAKPKPMGRQEAAAHRRRLNRQRLKEMEGGS